MTAQKERLMTDAKYDEIESIMNTPKQKLSLCSNERLTWTKKVLRNFAQLPEDFRDLFSVDLAAVNHLIQYKELVVELVCYHYTRWKVEVVRMSYYGEKVMLEGDIIMIRYYRGRVTIFNQSEARKHCSLPSDWLKFETLPRKYRTLLDS